MGIYLWTEGQEQQRQPGANTIAYYPLTSTSTVNDMSGNNRNLTNNGVTFGDYQGVNCAYFDGNSILSEGTITLNVIGRSYTIGCRFYSSVSGRKAIMANYKYLHSNPWTGCGRGIVTSQNDEYIYQDIVTNLSGTSNEIHFTGCVSGNSAWTLLQVVVDNNTAKAYINGTQVSTTSWSGNSFDYNNFRIGGIYDEESGNYALFNGGISNIIIEDTPRTAQEISDYYNLTKGNYGIS